MKKYSGFSLFKHSLSHHENWQAVWRSPQPKNNTMSSLLVAVDMVWRLPIT